MSGFIIEQQLDDLHSLSNNVVRLLASAVNGHLTRLLRELFRAMEATLLRNRQTALARGHDDIVLLMNDMEGLVIAGQTDAFRVFSASDAIRGPRDADETLVRRYANDPPVPTLDSLLAPLPWLYVANPFLFFEPRTDPAWQIHQEPEQ